MGLSIIKEEVDEIVMDCDYFMEKEGILKDKNPKDSQLIR